MKVLRSTTLVAALLIALGATVHAQTAQEPITPGQQLRTKVMKMIRHANLTDVPRHQRDVTIEFIITRDDQLVLTSIDGYNEYLTRFVKQRLNYKPIDVKGVRKMTTYTLDVQFVARA